MSTFDEFVEQAGHGLLNKDHFEITSLIGKGGQGSVHLAKHKESGATVVLKRCFGFWFGREESIYQIFAPHDYPSNVRIVGGIRGWHYEGSSLAKL